MRPKIEVTSFDDGADLEFKLDLEVLPDVPEVRSDILDYLWEIEWFDQHLGRMLVTLDEAGLRWIEVADVLGHWVEAVTTVWRLAQELRIYFVDNLKHLVESEDKALKQQESSSRKAGERAF